MARNQRAGTDAMHCRGTGRTIRRVGGLTILSIACLGVVGAAHAAAVADAGCERLAAAIVDAVGAALTARLAGRLEPEQQPAAASAAEALARCASTAATASAAFSRVVESFGIGLDWYDAPPAGAAEACGSGRIDRCRPRPRGGSTGPGAAGQAVAERAWTAVSAAVASQMPHGAPGDISRFRPAELRALIAVRVASALAASPAVVRRREDVGAVRPVRSSGAGAASPCD